MPGKSFHDIRTFLRITVFWNSCNTFYSTIFEISKIERFKKVGFVADEQISSISELPQRYQIINDPVLSSWGIRFTKVNNYLALYTVDENRQLVIIVRFLYQKSNWSFIT